MVKDFQRVNETEGIRKLLKVLGQDFTLSQNINSRKGGLIGLAAMAIALGKVKALLQFSVKILQKELIYRKQNDKHTEHLQSVLALL